MRLDLCAVGKARRGPELELFERYRDRVVQVGRTVGITAFDLHEIAEAKPQRAADRRAQETAKLLQAIPDNAFCVALDERGKSLTSAAFAEFIRKTRDDGAPAMAFLIGGADGLDQDKTTAFKRIALGPATWPHMLVRALIAEQLYRAVTILANHPYHREG